MNHGIGMLPWVEVNLILHRYYSSNLTGMEDIGSYYRITKSVSTGWFCPFQPLEPMAKCSRSEVDVSEHRAHHLTQSVQHGALVAKILCHIQNPHCREKSFQGVAQIIEAHILLAFVLFHSVPFEQFTCSNLHTTFVSFRSLVTCLAFGKASLKVNMWSTNGNTM